MSLLWKIAHSRRLFLRNIALSAGTAAAASIFSERLQGQWRGRDKAAGPPAAHGVYLDANENPLGPSAAAIKAAIHTVPAGGRYYRYLAVQLVKTFAAQVGLSPDYVTAFPGSNVPLCETILAYTSPQKSLITVDPGYEAVFRAAEGNGAKVVKVPLTTSYGHDVHAMLRQADDAGVIYICNPNNPTGTTTSFEDIEYLVAHKPKDAIVIVDEAYIHYTNDRSAIELVGRNKNVLVLRTFSKIYGMAGLRLGLAIAHPDLLACYARFGRVLLPTPTVAAAQASLEDRTLVAERKKNVDELRAETFEWLRDNHYSFIPSVTNFFLVDVRRPGQEVADLLSDHEVFIGRSWPALPTWSRVTIGTREEMLRFQTVFQQVMQGPTTAAFSRLDASGRHRQAEILC